MFTHQAIFHFRLPNDSDDALLTTLQRSSCVFGRWQQVPGYRPSFEPAQHFEDLFTRIEFQPKADRGIEPGRCTLTVNTDTKLTGFGWAALLVGFVFPPLWLLVAVFLYFAHQKAVRCTDRLLANVTAECLFAATQTE